MKNFLIFFTMFIFSSPGLCYASSKNTLEPYFATGEKSQTDGIEDRDLSGSFKYYKYGLSFNSKPQDAPALKLAFEEYRKDFLNNIQSDVNTYTSKMGVGFPLLNDKDSSLDADLDFLVRNKRYDDSPNSEYDQIETKGAIKYKLKDMYSLGVSGGINNYEYRNRSDSDVLKTFLKLSPEVYLFDKTLELGGFFRIRWLDNSGNNKDATETILSGDTALSLEMPLLYKIKAGIETGKENTQDTEDREDSLRYKYTKWDITTYHKFNKRLKTQLEYGQKRRDYLSDNNDYENWHIENKSNFKLLESELFDLNLFTEGEHKETEFNKAHSNSYIKNEITGGLSFLKMANWSLKPEFTFTKYNYTSESTSDENSYRAKVSAKKYINENFILEGYYWYKWKDYRYKPDIEQWTLNLSCSIKF